uniref:Ionotropic glutamate receptor L-glutamate and glycine-binding domain-containing protein n=1 Tax=Plectus sambesii TaxID=2011161 RepID=A0A914XG91_9BILA
MNRTNKNVLVLGYVQANKPWLSNCGVDARKWSTCSHPGMCVEIWRSLIPLLGYRDVQLRRSSAYGYRNERGRWNGLLGMLQRGEIDATLSNMVVDEERFSDFTFAYPFSQLRFGFAIGQEVVDESELSLQVQVFAQWVFVMLFAITVVVGVISSVQMGNFKAGFWRAVSSSLMQHRSIPGVHTPFVILGYTILIAVYNSGFKSQALAQTSVSEVKQVPMRNIVEKLRTRQYQLVIENIAQLPQPVLQTIVQSETGEDVDAASVFDLLIEPNQAIIADLLCRSDRAVYYGPIDSLFSANPDKRKCFLSEMRVDNVKVSRLSPLSFAFRRGFNDSTLQEINSRLLRVFTQAHMGGFLGSRYRMNDPRRQTTHGTVQAINLRQLSTGFFFWLGGIGVSLLCFTILKLRQVFFAMRITMRDRTMRQALSRSLSTYSC